MNALVWSTWGIDKTNKKLTFIKTSYDEGEVTEMELERGSYLTLG